MSWLNDIQGKGRGNEVKPSEDMENKPRGSTPKEEANATSFP